jgi:hypothetical protein
MIYYLSLKLSEVKIQGVKRRRIGGKTISKILTKHYRLYTPIPKETISCWIDGRRTPKNAFLQLKDAGLVDEEFNKIVDELTQEHMDFHLSKALYDIHGWPYSKISKELQIDKEKVRGWVTKNRGSPVAKCFKNQDIIEDKLKIYVNETSFNGGGIIETPVKDEIVVIQDDFNYELEDEVLYHLAFFPGGLSSPQAIKSILIENKESSIDDILKVLNNSNKITKKGNKWVLIG